MSKHTTFGRLGTWADVERQIKIAKAADAKVVVDRASGSVIATLGNEHLFRAIEKSKDVWIVMYSSKFYPQN